MIYKVEIGYNEFTFTDGSNALAFAEIAVNKSTEEVEATITIKHEEKENE